MRLVLVGLRGSGKTTSGRAAATVLGVPFFDLDALIEARGRTIPDIFAAEGEEGFRRIERGVLLSLAPPAHAVIATGGGAVLHPDNRTRLATLGHVVYLHAAPEILAARIAGSDRPRLLGADAPAAPPRLTGPDALAETRALLARREPLYRGLAEHALDTGVLSEAEVVEALVAFARARGMPGPAGSAPPRGLPRDPPGGGP